MQTWGVAQFLDRPIPDALAMRITVSFGLLNSNRTGSSNVTSDGANPSTITYINSNNAAYFTVGAAGAGVAVSGNFDVTWKLAGASFGAWEGVGVFVTAESSDFSAASPSGALGTMADSYWVVHNNGLVNRGPNRGGSNVAVVNSASSDVWRINRSGTTYTWYQNDTQVGQVTGASTSDVYVALSHANGFASPAADLSQVQVIT